MMADIEWCLGRQNFERDERVTWMMLRQARCIGSRRSNLGKYGGNHFLLQVRRE